jgi:carboxyl-terminal processing protease
MSRLPSSFRIVFVFTLGLVLGLGLSVGRTVQADRDIEVAPKTRPVRWEDARLFAEVLERVREEYVDDVADEELIVAAIRGLMADLDPHSAFLGPAEMKELRISTTGEYSGVGIEVAVENGTVRVATPIEGGPAYLAGVQGGDRILAVDDVAVDPDDLEATIDRMRGKAGSVVKLTFSRPPDDTPREIALTRAKVQVSSVKSHLLEPDLGYVRITQENGRKLGGLVLDLRDNPGGLLEAGVAVADAFLDDGVIVTANGRAPDARFEMTAKRGDLLDGAPITILVNGHSASASEIVAGALHDHGRATLIGRQTYGKGSVQTVVPLSSGHALKLTTSRYYTPSGASIHEKGITPDIVVDPSEIEAAGLADSSVVIGDLGADYELRLALETVKTSTRPGAVAASQSRAP